jgi:hypothetical protein
MLRETESGAWLGLAEQHSTTRREGAFMMTVGDLYRMLDMMIARRPPGVLGRDVHLIDYAHMVGDVLYHGTVSDFDGSVRATWTYEEGQQKVTRERTIDEPRFELLWGGLSSGEVFKRSIPNDMARAVRPDQDHVIGAVYTEGGAPGWCVILVPAHESDPDFVRWLTALDPPMLTK